MLTRVILAAPATVKRTTILVVRGGKLDDEARELDERPERPEIVADVKCPRGLETREHSLHIRLVKCRLSSCKAILGVCDHCVVPDMVPTSHCAVSAAGRHSTPGIAVI